MDERKVMRSVGLGFIDMVSFIGHINDKVRSTGRSLDQRITFMRYL